MVDSVELSRTLIPEETADKAVAERTLVALGVDMTGTKRNFAQVARQANVKGADSVGFGLAACAWKRNSSNHCSLPRAVLLGAHAGTGYAHLQP